MRRTTQNMNNYDSNFCRQINLNDLVFYSNIISILVLFFFLITSLLNSKFSHIKQFIVQS